MRAVIYARYSSDLQRDASIEDQVRVCRRRIDAEGWSLERVYSDHGMSGASHLRAGYQALLAGREEAAVRRRRRREPRPPVARSGTRGGPLQAALVPWRDLADDRRGRDFGAARRAQGRDERPLPQGPRAKDAARTGGPGATRPIRWRPVVRLSNRAGDRPGRRADDGRARSRRRYEAEVVRSIFADFAAGKSPRAIAKDLNDRGVRRAARRSLGRVDDLRQLAARHRHPEQRALCRPARLEPPTFRQGPRDGPAPGSTQPRGRMGRRGRPRPAHRQRRRCGRA